MIRLKLKLHAAQADGLSSKPVKYISTFGKGWGRDVVTISHFYFPSADQAVNVLGRCYVPDSA